mmetsp:Transcript_9157/g.22485  ORF Transcript_9157/g.22485 Transcript_9157/m.22485 type:complete len:121 (+) Transcript_9157:82-444(+)
MCQKLEFRNRLPHNKEDANHHRNISFGPDGSDTSHEIPDVTHLTNPGAKIPRISFAAVFSVNFPNTFAPKSCITGKIVGKSGTISCAILGAFSVEIVPLCKSPEMNSTSFTRLSTVFCSF